MSILKLTVFDQGTVSPSKGNQTKTAPTSSAKTEKQLSQNKKPKKPLKSLKDFPLHEIFFKWYREENDNIFRKAVEYLGIKGDKGDIERLVKLLGIAAVSYSEVKRNFTRIFTISIIIIFGILQMMRNQQLKNLITILLGFKNLASCT